MFDILHFLPYTAPTMTHDEALKILQLPANATPTEIRGAYRRMAAKYHPDRNPNNKSAEEMFKLVNQANRILTGRERVRPEYQTPPQSAPAQPRRRATFRDFAAYVNFIITDLESKNLDDAARAKLDEFKKTFKTITTMNRFVNCAFMASFIGMLSMFAYNQIFGYDAPHVGMVVYPVIGGLVISGALVQDKLKVKTLDLAAILEDLMRRTR